MDDAMWQQDLTAALHLENLFISEHLGHTDMSMASAFLKPTRADTERAVANIRTWRSYLPEACVAKMIDDGWQWST